MSYTPAVLPLEQAADYLALSVSTFQRLIRENKAPQPRQLSDRRVGWLTRELSEWADGLPVSSILPPDNTGAPKPRQ